MAVKMATAISIVFILLLQGPETFQSVFKRQAYAKIIKRSFATDHEVCPEGFEWSDDKGLCLSCGQGYYRSRCMSACAKCAEPTNPYERLLRHCTVSRNSIVVCKDNADAADRLCTRSNAVQLDCDEATAADDPAITTASTRATPRTTQQATITALTRIGSEITTRLFRSLRPITTDLKSLQTSEVEEPPSKISFSDWTTVGEQNQNENVTDNHYKFVAAYLTTIVTMVAMMAAAPFMPCLIQIQNML